MNDLPAPVADDEEAVELPEKHRWNREEVHCCYVLHMVFEKYLPFDDFVLIRFPPGQVAGDRTLRNIEAELEQFTMYARRSP